MNITRIAKYMNRHDCDGLRCYASSIALGSILKGFESMSAKVSLQFSHYRTAGGDPAER